MLFLLPPFLFISIFLDCFSLVQRSFLRSVVRELVRSKIFCSSFLPYHIFSSFHVLHCFCIHSFFEYNKSLCEMSVQLVLFSRTGSVIRGRPRYSSIQSVGPPDTQDMPTFFLLTDQAYLVFFQESLNHVPC